MPQDSWTALVNFEQVRGLLFGRSRSLPQTDPKQVASLVNGFPEFIRLARFEFHRFITDGADGETRVRGVGHSSLRDHQIAQETDAQNGVRRRDV